MHEPDQKLKTQGTAPSQLLAGLESSLLKGAQEIARRLGEAGHSALLAGGVVRDLLLSRPVSDVDIACSAPPQEVERLFEHTVAVGKQFGVVIVVLAPHQFEVTTFRRETAYLDGRHPSQVTFSDARDDALRRDFTVNALFADPFSGRVTDYVQGRRDLQAGIIRTVGDPCKRFEEDKLRILRAVRFAANLGFEIEAGTFRQVCAAATNLEQVSRERIRDELVKILTGPDASRGLGLLLESGILQVILPEAAAMQGVEQPPKFHPEGDVFVHTCLMFEKAGQISDPNLALGILLHDVGKPPTFTVKDRIRFDGHAELGAKMSDEVCRRLRLSNIQREEVVELVRHHLRFIHVRQMRESTLKRFLRLDNFEKHLELHRLDCLASHGDLSSYEYCREKLEELAAQPLKPKPLINGRDLIEMGLKPGPVFGKILSQLEDLQLEGVLKSRREALEWVRELTDPLNGLEV